MDHALTLGLKALNGGLFVVAFALIGEIVFPKRFSGIFSGAPSVATANLIVVVVLDGLGAVRDNATGMVLGALAITAAALAGIGLVSRLGALKGSGGIWVVWFAAALPGYWLVLA